MRTFAFLVCLTFAVLASTATASTISCYKVEDGYCGQVALSKAVEKEAVKYAGLTEGSCADVGYTVAAGSRKISIPVLGRVEIDLYIKPTPSADTTITEEVEYFYRTAEEAGLAMCGEIALAKSEIEQKASMALHMLKFSDGKCADNGYSVEEGEKEWNLPQIGSVTVSLYAKDHTHDTDAGADADADAGADAGADAKAVEKPEPMLKWGKKIWAYMIAPSKKHCTDFKISDYELKSVRNAGYKQIHSGKCDQHGYPYFDWEDARVIPKMRTVKYYVWRPTPKHPKAKPSVNTNTTSTSTSTSTPAAQTKQRITYNSRSSINILDKSSDLEHAFFYERIMGELVKGVEGDSNSEPMERFPVHLFSPTTELSCVEFGLTGYELQTAIRAGFLISRGTCKEAGYIEYHSNGTEVAYVRGDVSYLIYHMQPAGHIDPIAYLVDDINVDELMKAVAESLYEVGLHRSDCYIIAKSLMHCTQIRLTDAQYKIARNSPEVPLTVHKGTCSQKRYTEYEKEGSQRVAPGVTISYKQYGPEAGFDPKNPTLN